MDAFPQRFRKVTPGTPGDTQLATYFLETDFVMSADKALIDTLQECRPYAPCRLPAGKLVPAGNPGVDALFEFLDSSMGALAARLLTGSSLGNRACRARTRHRSGGR